MCGRVLLWLTIFAPAVVDAAPFLEGRVTDEQGRPIQGATVQIWDCVGTCFPGPSTFSDAEGRYVFEKKNFRNFPSLKASMPGRYLVSTEQTGPELHEPDTDVPRVANFVLGTPAAAIVHVTGDAPEGWKQWIVVRAGRDVKLHRYDLDGKFISGWNHWYFEAIPRAEPVHVVLIREPLPTFTGDSKKDRELQREARRRQVEIVSPAFQFPDPQQYDLRVDVRREGDDAYLAVTSVIDALREDRTDELVSADPTIGPPVDAERRKQALALLKRVELAATPWIAIPPKGFMPYEYDFVADGTTIHVRIDTEFPSGPEWTDFARQRGGACMPALRWILSEPENVIVQGIDLAENRAELTYRLVSGRRFTFGLGIRPKSHVYFSSPFTTGRIIIDPKSATVLEHRFSAGPLGEISVETFGDYVPVGDGFAPRSLRIQSGQFDFKLAFKVHTDRLWLLDHALRGENSEPINRVENVVLTAPDGTPAEPAPDRD